MTANVTEKHFWDQTKALLGTDHAKLGKQTRKLLLEQPKELIGYLSRCKFASKMGGIDKHLLELSCGEGFGAAILGEQSLSYTGIDSDEKSIASAKQNFLQKKYQFLCDKEIGKKFGTYDTIVCFKNLIQDENLWFCIKENLAEHGIVLLGAKPEEYEILSKFFHQVLPFGMNDEILQTSLPEYIQFSLFICCHKKL